MVTNFLAAMADVGGYVKSTHVVNADGTHSSEWFDLSAMYAEPNAVRAVAAEIAAPFVSSDVGRPMRAGEDHTGQKVMAFADEDQRVPVSVVCGMSGGGELLAHLVAQHLKVKSAFAVYDEMVQDVILPEHFTRNMSGKGVLAIIGQLYEDPDKNMSAMRMLHKLRHLSDRLVGVSVVADLSGGEAVDAAVDVGQTEAVRVMQTLRIDRYAPKFCHLCKAGVDINTDVGHGQRFVNETRCN